MKLLRTSFPSKYRSSLGDRQRRPILARSLFTLLAPVVAITGVIGLPVTAKGVVVLTKSGTIILDSLVSVNDTSTLSTTTSGSNIQISGTGASTQLFTGVTQLRINFGSAGQTVTLDSTNFSFTPTISVGTSGPGTMDSIVKNGANTVKFSGSNNYIGGTTVNGGTISIDNASALGSGIVTLKAGTELTSTGTINLANEIDSAATGSDTISTTGTLILNDLRMPGGTVVFGSAGHAGIVSIANNLSSSVATGAQLQVAFGTLRNDGQLNFFSSVASMMTVNSGATLAINDINTSVNHLQGAGKVTLGTKAATNLTIDNGGFDGVISGAGIVTAMGNVTLTGANTYTGGTQVSTASVLQIGNGGTTGAITGNIADSGLLVFARSNATTYAGPIGGTGGLQQSGTGVLTLTGANTYAGGTTIQSGKLSIGNAAAIGTGTVTLLNGTEFTTTGTVNLPQLVSFATSGTSTISTTGTLVLNRIGMATTTGAVDIFGSAGHAGIVAVAGSAGSSVSNGTKIEVAFGTLRNDGGLGYYGSGEASGFAVDAGATLNVNDHSMGVYALSGAGKVTLGTNAATNLSLTGGNFSGVISGAGSVTATVGEVVLSGANTYTGGSSIAGAAILQIGQGATGTTGSIVGPVSDAGSLAFFRGNAVTFAGAISGAGNVTQAGPGVLILTGSSSYTGGTTIAHGTISINNGNALGTGPVHLDAGTELTTTGTMTLANPIDFDIGGSSTLSTTGTLSVTYLSMGLGTNETVIFGSAGHTGTIAVPSGTGNIDTSTKIEVAFGTLRNDFGLGVYTSNAASTTVDTGATLAVNDNSMTVKNLQGAGKVTLGTKAATQLTIGGGLFSGVISGAGGIISSGTLVLTGSNTYTGGTQIAANSSVQVGSGGTTGSIVGNVTGNGANSGLIFNRSNALTFAGNISGFTAVYQNGAGVTTLTGNNTYSGGTTISDGTISISSATALGTNNIQLDPGGELTTTGTITLGNFVTFGQNGSGTLSTSGTLIVSKFDLAGGAGSTAVFGSAGHTGTIGVGSGTASADTGTQMVVAFGTLRNDGGLNFFTSSMASTTVNAGATLAVNDGSMTVKNLQGAGKVTLGTKVATTLTIGSGNFSGVISGAGGIISSGTLVLTGSNTYTGGTQIAANSSVQVGSGGTTGSIMGNVTGSGANSGLIFNRSNALTFAGNISGFTAVYQNGAGVTTLTGNNTYSGGTTISDGTISISSATALGTNNIQLDPGGELTTTGTITLGNFVTFGQNGSGTLSTSGTLIVSKFDLAGGAGSTAVFGSAGHTGTIGVGSGTASADTGTQMVVAFGTLRNDGGLNFFTSSMASTTVNAAATLAVNDGSMTVKNLQGAGKVTLGTNAATVLTIGSGNFSGVISGAGHLNTSNLTLSGANTYLGGTTVSGSLVANNTTGSATGTGLVDVTTNAVLGGNGKISGPITLESNSILYPGAGSPGTAGSKLHGASMIWNGNATLKFQIGATADELMLTGALTKGAGNTFAIDIFDTGIVAGNYTLLTFGSTNFSLSDFTLALPTNYSGMLVETSTSLMVENLHGPMSMQSMAEPLLVPSSFSNASAGAGDSSIVQAVPAPEPGSVVLLTLGLGSLLGRRRNRGIAQPVRAHS